MWPRPVAVPETVATDPIAFLEATSNPSDLPLSLSHHRKRARSEGSVSAAEDGETENSDRRRHEKNEERRRFLQRRRCHLQLQLQPQLQEQVQEPLQESLQEQLEEPRQLPYGGDHHGHDLHRDSGEFRQEQEHPHLRTSRKRAREISSMHQEIPPPEALVHINATASMPTVPLRSQKEQHLTSNTHHQDSKRVRLLSSLSALSIQTSTAQPNVSISQNQHFHVDHPSSLWQMNQLLHQLHQERCSRRQDVANQLPHNSNSYHGNYLHPSQHLSLQASSTSSSLYDNHTNDNDVMDDDDYDVDDHDDDNDADEEASSYRSNAATNVTSNSDCHYNPSQQQFPVDVNYNNNNYNNYHTSKNNNKSNQRIFCRSPSP